MNSWPESRRLVVLMAVIASFSIIGRIVADARERLAASGSPW